ncbi:MAG TPA: hypothetical protein VJQ47_04245 [Steroidobacteraceae bacterium]|nr:hypothetical protein [Steroidobacteraceae bacterium]
MKIYGADDKELMLVTAIDRDGGSLVVKGKIFGTMPIAMKIPPQTVRSALRMISLRTLLFTISLLFRRSSTRETR